MSIVSVTSKGQVTIPVKVRRALGIEPGAKVTFTAKNGVAQLEIVKRHAQSTLADGAGLLRAHGKPRSLRNFDASSLLKRGK